MEQDDTLFSEFNQLLGMPSFTDQVSSSTGEANLLQDFPSLTSEFFWELPTSQEELSLFSFPQVLQNANDSSSTIQIDSSREDVTPSAPSQTQSQNNEPKKTVSTQTESPRRRANLSARPRFVPPKGPRKQHRSGFRQAPGPNGVVKKGRPSKSEYKLGGIEVDMYALKGVILNGPVKCLDDIKGGEVLKKPVRKGKRKATAKQIATANSTDASTIAAQANPATELPGAAQTELSLGPFGKTDHHLGENHTWWLPSSLETPSNSYRSGETIPETQSLTRESHEALVPHLNVAFNSDYLALVGSNDSTHHNLGSYLDPPQVSMDGFPQSSDFPDLNLNQTSSQVDSSSFPHFSNFPALNPLPNSTHFDNVGLSQLTDFSALNIPQTFQGDSSTSQQYADLLNLNLQQPTAQVDTNMAENTLHQPLGYGWNEIPPPSYPNPMGGLGAENGYSNPQIPHGAQFNSDTCYPGSEYPPVFQNFPFQFTEL